VGFGGGRDSYENPTLVLFFSGMRFYSYEKGWGVKKGRKNNLHLLIISVCYTGLGIGV
jgi:hypothetical protein